LLDAADAKTIDGSDSEVTVLTPGLSPGVSHDVVLDAVFGSVTNGDDGMVQTGAAILAGDDAAFVLLEYWRIGLNSD